MNLNLKGITRGPAMWWSARSILVLLLVMVIVKVICVDRDGTDVRAFARSAEFTCDLPWWDGALDNCSLVTQTFIDQGNTTRSYCGKRADVIGPGQKVITYCLYGPYEVYATGFESILRSIQSLYPGWLVRLYTQPQNYTNELMPLLQQYSNLYVCDVANLPGGIPDWRGIDPRLWRAAVLGDELVDVFVSRDIDAEVLERDAAAVEEFLASGKSLHIMRDHPNHRSTILAGMFGLRQKPNHSRKLDAIRKKFFEPDSKGGSDQYLLKIYLYKPMKDDLIIHDSYRCNLSVYARPYPTQRYNFSFIGNRKYRPNVVDKIVKEPCPPVCRPSAHQDWEYC